VAKRIDVPVYNKDEYIQKLNEKTAAIKEETAPGMLSGRPVHPQSQSDQPTQSQSDVTNSTAGKVEDLSPEDFLSEILAANPEITTPEVVTAAKNAGLAITGQWVGRRLAALRKAGSVVGSAVGAVAGAVADAVSGDLDSQEPSTSPAETDSDSEY
jgi:hypothetical protein